MEYELRRTQRLPRPLEETFTFFARPENLARITPAWLDFRIRTSDLSMRQGLRIEYRIRPLGFPIAWVSVITAYEPPHHFVDEQVKGPYRSWHHEHWFRAVPGGTEVTDTVRYALPYGPLGRVAHALLVRRQLQSIFDYRERALGALLGAASTRPGPGEVRDGGEAG